LGKLAACPKFAPKAMRLIAVRTRIPSQPFARNPLDFLFISLLLCKEYHLSLKGDRIKKGTFIIENPHRSDPIRRTQKVLQIIVD
jgi:hypothetical protein